MPELAIDDNAHGPHHLAHQFDDADQQRAAGTLGMWVFLATEVLFFGALFAGLTVYRLEYFQTFSDVSRNEMKWGLGTINTGVLLCSSFTMVLAVHAAAHGRQKGIVRFLLATIALGVAFLFIKGFEYFLEYREGLVPWLDFRYAGPHPERAKLFFCFYFFMTGLHALHMVIGIAIMSILAVKAHRGRYTADYYNPVDIAALYWHFVDLVWIFLFPALYLVR